MSDVLTPDQQIGLWVLVTTDLLEDPNYVWKACEAVQGAEEGVYATVCIQHPRAGLMCAWCLGQHAGATHSESLFTCFKCGEPADESELATVPHELAQPLTTHTALRMHYAKRSRRSYRVADGALLSGMVFLSGISVCKKCRDRAPEPS